MSESEVFSSSFDELIDAKRCSILRGECRTAYWNMTWNTNHQVHDILPKSNMNIETMFMWIRTPAKQTISINKLNMRNPYGSSYLCTLKRKSISTLLIIPLSINSEHPLIDILWLPYTSTKSISQNPSLWRLSFHDLCGHLFQHSSDIHRSAHLEYFFTI